MNINFISLFNISFKLYHMTKEYFKKQNIDANITHAYYNIFSFYKNSCYKDFATSVIYKTYPYVLRESSFNFLDENDKMYIKLTNKKNIENHLVVDTTHNLINSAKSFYNMKYYNIYDLNYDLFNLSSFKKDIIDIVKNIVDTIEYNDIFCFSLYRNPEIHVLFAILLKKKYPTCRIIAGGLYQAYTQSIVDYFKYFDIEWYFGDVHIVLKNIINNTMNENMFISSYDDNPLYVVTTADEMYINLSRGCMNNCHYCVGHYLGAYTRMSISKIERWFKIINMCNIKKVYVMDSELNTQDNWFDDFLDMMLQHNFKFSLSIYLFINKLNQQQIKKLNKLNIQICCSVDSSGKSVNRYTNFMILKNIIKLNQIQYNKCNPEYVSNCLFISDKQFDKDLKYIQYLANKNIKVSIGRFSLHLNSNFYKYKEKFNIDILYHKQLESRIVTEDIHLNNILDELPIFYKHDLSRQVFKYRWDSLNNIID